TLTLLCPELALEGLVIAFEEQSGWLVASIAQSGWLPRLAENQRQGLHNALVGLYKLAGVDFVRQEVEAFLDPALLAYDFEDEGLLVWPREASEGEAVYDLVDAPALVPRLKTVPFPVTLPTLPALPFWFSKIAVTWERWVATWEADRHAGGKFLLEEVRLLP